MNMKRSSRSNIVITWLIFIEVFTLILTENPSNSEQKKKTKKRGILFRISSLICNNCIR